MLLCHIITVPCKRSRLFLDARDNKRLQLIDTRSSLLEPRRSYPADERRLIKPICCFLLMNSAPQTLCLGEARSETCLVGCWQRSGSAPCPRDCDHPGNRFMCHLLSQGSLVSHQEAALQLRHQQALAGRHREGGVLRDSGRRGAGHEGGGPGGQPGPLRQVAAPREMLRQVRGTQMSQRPRDAGGTQRCFLLMFES